MIFLAIFVSIPFIYNVTTAKTAQVLGYATSISIGQLSELTNQERANNGLAPLTLDSRLNSAAAAKASHMFANNYWAHVAPDGTTPWSFIYAAGYNYNVAGENLAKDFNTSSGVVAGWMASPTHRANVINSAYNDVGFAVVNGNLLGSDTTLVVAMYATRVAPPAPVVAQSQPVAPAAQVVADEPTSPVPVTAPPAPQPAVQVQSESVAVPQAEPASDTTAKTQPAAQSGQVEGLATTLPVRIYTSMNWGQKASLVLLSVLGLLFIMKHTIVWRQQRRGLRNIWLRSHPISQLAMLSSAFIVTLLSSTGIIL